MSAKWILQTMSDHALNQSIRQLERNRQWAERLNQLLREKTRREKRGITIKQERLEL